MQFFAHSNQLNDYNQDVIPTSFKTRHNLRSFGYLRYNKASKPRPTSEEFLFASKIIKKAIYKYAPPNFADAIINNYRRSDGTDEAAEINFLKADLPEFKHVNDLHYQKALRVTERLFRPSKKLKPVAFPDLRYYPWTLPTSAEAPFTVKQKYKDHIKDKHSLGLVPDPRTNFHNLYNEIFIKNRLLIHKIKSFDSKFFHPDGTPKPYYFHSLHTRAHLVRKDELDKNRAVFGTPKLLLMAENMFLWPLQKEYLNNETKHPLLWGFETFKGGWKRLHHEIFSNFKPNTFLGIDWSGFDRRALFSVIDDVHKIWKSYFTFNEGYEPTSHYPESRSQTSPSKIENLWNWMTYSIKFTPIRAASNRLYQFTWNGIASGYQQTQLLDSFVNTIMILTCLSSLGVNIESDSFFIKVQGDDSIVAISEHIYRIYGKHFLVMIRDEAFRRFNAELNPGKSQISNHLNDIEVLSYKNRFGTAYRDNAQLLAQLLYPERSYRTLSATASACIGIAMASMGTSKIVYDICFDAWNHIMNDLKTQPAIMQLNWLFASPESTTIDNSRFPSFEEIKDQQYFWNKERTESQKQHLWPSDQTKEFYFLRR